MHKDDKIALCISLCEEIAESPVILDVAKTFHAEYMTRRKIKRQERRIQECIRRARARLNYMITGDEYSLEECQRAYYEEAVFLSVVINERD